MNQKMKSTFYDRQRNGDLVRSQNRKYFSKGTSPDNNLTKQKNSYDFFQVTSPLTNPINQRYPMPNYPHRSGYIDKKQDKTPLSFYDLDSDVVNSMNIFGNRKRKGRTMHKKIEGQLTSGDHIFENRNNGITEISKPSRSEQTNEIKQIDVQQIHYKMVQQQQICKKIIIN